MIQDMFTVIHMDIVCSCFRFEYMIKINYGYVNCDLYKIVCDIIIKNLALDIYFSE